MTETLPHEGVFVRLGPSPIAGVGVFAAGEIPAGTNVFATDHTQIRWVDENELKKEQLTPFERSLYDDFAIRHEGKLGCPPTFNLLSVGWYVNEPPEGQQPNLEPTTQCDLVAIRTITEGEELTLSYEAYGNVLSGRHESSAEPDGS